MLKTPGQELRDQFMENKMIEENHDDDLYLNKLKDLGVNPHPSIFPAFFQLKNGLKYPGMATSEPILPGETLIQVPEKLVLSSIKALQEPNLVDVFQDPYFHEIGCWEDRVLLTYCLYLCSIEDTSNIFYHMVQHMSKEIDIACFWPEEEIDLFRDKIVKTATKLDRQSFENEWASFQKVRDKFGILQSASFGKENFKWIFIHITSRCFGKSIDHTSFVPFCQFFNHHVSGVYYKVENHNVNVESEKQAETDKDEEKEDPIDNSDEVSSSGTYESDDYLEEGEFAYGQVDVIPYLWEGKQCLNLDKKQKHSIESFSEKLLREVETSISWNDFSILFAGRFIEKVKIAQNEFLQGRKKYEQTDLSLKNLQTILETYAAHVQKFYKKKNGRMNEYLTNIQLKEKKDRKVSKEFTRPDPRDYKAPYSVFAFETDKFDKFNPHSEVYFCYGRDSNRTLLLRYGFAIEGNKYDHVWMSYDIGASLKTMPDLFQRVKKLGISLRRKFKLNHTRINIDLIMFHRLLNWNLYSIKSLNQIFFVTDIDKEISILNEVQFSLHHKLKIMDGNEDLTDKSLNYHQYFIAVFHIEQVRILKKQINYLAKMKQILKKMNKGISRAKAEDSILTPAEKYVFRHYLDTVII